LVGYGLADDGVELKKVRFHPQQRILHLFGREQHTFFPNVMVV